MTFQGYPAKGFTPVALWVKLTLSGQDIAEQLALTVNPAFIRRVELYDPYLHSSGKPLTPVLSGRDANITAANRIGLANGFVVPSSKEPRDIFLRVTTTTTLVVDIDVLTLDDADPNSHLIAGILSVYFAFLFAFLLWSLASWAVRRDLLYGLFALRLLFSMLHIFVMTGLFRYFFSGILRASVRDNVYNLVLVSVIAVTASFDFKLISDFGVPRWLQRVAWSLLCLPVVSLLLLFLGHTQDALRFNALLVSVVVIMSVILAFSERKRGKSYYGRLSVNTIRFGFVLMVMVVILPALIATSIIDTGVPVIKIVFLHAVISTAILFTVLLIRAQQKDLLAQQSLVQYEIKERVAARKRKES